MLIHVGLELTIPQQKAVACSCQNEGVVVGEFSCSVLLCGVDVDNVYAACAQMAAAIATCRFLATASPKIRPTNWYTKDLL